jgi:hypothetical protein
MVAEPLAGSSVIDLGGHKLPVTCAVALLAMRGAGKSNAAVTMAEDLFDQGVPWVAVDPKGDWWGIRSGPRGGEAGGLGVIIFGGLNGDLPLDAKAGPLIADLVVEQRLTCILDTSELSKAESIRFLEAFFDRLYRRKNKLTFPMHVFLEECDDYVPQKVYAQISGLVRAVEMLVKRGRARGLGITLVSQRAASINKDVLTQTDALVALRNTSPQDRKAIADWFSWHSAPPPTGDLAGLDNGHAWLSVPVQDVLAPVTFRRRRTFDSGATPELGEQAKAATLADIDLDALRTALKDQIERVEQDDPKVLRATIAALERQLREMPLRPAPEPEVIEVVSAEAVRLAEQALDHLDEFIADLRTYRDDVNDLLNELHATEQASVPTATSAAHVAVPVDRARAGNPPGKTHRRLLEALALHGPLDRQRLGVIVGLTPSAGHFGNLLSDLRRDGYITGDRNAPLQITAAGALWVDGAEQLPAPGAALLDWWCQKVGGRRADILRELAAAGGELSRTDLAVRLGLEPKAGHYGNLLSELRAFGIINGKQGEPIALDADLRP